MDTATEVAYISVPAPHRGCTFPLPLDDDSDDDLAAEGAVLRPRERADTCDAGAAGTIDMDAISRSILLVRILKEDDDEGCVVDVIFELPGWREFMSRHKFDENCEMVKYESFVFAFTRYSKSLLRHQNC